MIASFDFISLCGLTRLLSQFNQATRALLLPYKWAFNRFSAYRALQTEQLLCLQGTNGFPFRWAFKIGMFYCLDGPNGNQHVSPFNGPNGLI